MNTDAIKCHRCKRVTNISDACDWFFHQQPFTASPPLWFSFCPICNEFFAGVKPEWQRRPISEFDLEPSLRHLRDCYLGSPISFWTGLFPDFGPHAHTEISYYQLRKVLSILPYIPERVEAAKRHGNSAGLSLRHTYRLHAKYLKNGPISLVDRRFLRSKPGPEEISRRKSERKLLAQMRFRLQMRSRTSAQLMAIRRELAHAE